MGGFEVRSSVLPRVIEVESGVLLFLVLSVTTREESLTSPNFDAASAIYFEVLFDIFVPKLSRFAGEEEEDVEDVPEKEVLGEDTGDFERLAEEEEREEEEAEEVELRDELDP